MQSGEDFSEFYDSYAMNLIYNSAQQKVEARIR